MILYWQIKNNKNHTLHVPFCLLKKYILCFLIIKIYQNTYDYNYWRQYSIFKMYTQTYIPNPEVLNPDT